MNEIFPWCLTVGIISCIFGMMLGIHVSSRIYKQWCEKVNVRLKNIMEVVENFIAGEYEDDAHPAMSFIVCEADSTVFTVPTNKMVAKYMIVDHK